SITTRSARTTMRPSWAPNVLVITETPSDLVKRRAALSRSLTLRRSQEIGNGGQDGLQQRRLGSLAVIRERERHLKIAAADAQGAQVASVDVASDHRGGQDPHAGAGL